MTKLLTKIGRIMSSMFSTSLRSGSTVVINGVTYSGTNVSIVNGKVVVDGATQDQQLVGVWGQMGMPPHPNLKDDDIRAMIDWVLDHK
jgi:hypothetical protein